MSKIEVDAIEPQSGTSLTLGASGDTITIPSGATLTNSGTATGFGKVLQVVQSVYTTQTTFTSSSYVDSGLTATITPSNASNKILVIVNPSAYISINNAGSYPITFSRIMRDATQVMFKQNYNYAALGDNGYAEMDIEQNMVYLDSPNTTSAITYKTQFKVTVNAGTSTILLSYTGCASTITLLEISI
jgi:hypothetical protein